MNTPIPLPPPGEWNPRGWAKAMGRDVDDAKYAPDGTPREAVTEARLVEIGDAVRGVTLEYTPANRQVLVDIADYLSGRYGDPGTAYPQRLPIPDTSDVLALAAALDHLRELATELTDALIEREVPFEPRIWNAYWAVRGALGDPAGTS